ncbi:MAG: hypothetical protein MR301_00350 [Prevotella sp.]|nr:hypothetical protein [Prevotella sp.]MDD7046660.1 hypothetical protein [Prevotella sp.]MDY5547467.1 hypothetical protein [Prevotella sp.]
MRTDDKTLTQFTTRIRQMILQYQDIKKENTELYAMVDERDEEIASLKAQLSEAQNNYTLLKMAKMLEITDGDMETTQKRIAKLIRDVNKCITLLSE